MELKQKTHLWNENAVVWMEHRTEYCLADGFVYRVLAVSVDCMTAHSLLHFWLHHQIFAIWWKKDKEWPCHTPKCEGFNTFLRILMKKRLHTELLNAARQCWVKCSTNYSVWQYSPKPPDVSSPGDTVQQDISPRQLWPTFTFHYAQVPFGLMSLYHL